MATFQLFLILMELILVVLMATMVLLLLLEQVVLAPTLIYGAMVQRLLIKLI